MKTPFEILLRGTPDGKFQGAHVIDIQGGKPRPIKPEDWPAVCDAIKSMSFATLADVDAAKKEVMAKAKEFTEYKALVLAEATALKAATLDPAKDTDMAALAAVEKVLATEAERKRLALLAEQARIADALAKLPQ
jgi:hypothetical protein